MYSAEAMTNPWRDCERVYVNHFMDRMRERHLPRAQVEEAIMYGKKIFDGKGQYTVQWSRWTLKVSLGRCILFLRTAYLDL